MPTYDTAKVSDDIAPGEAYRAVIRQQHAEIERLKVFESRYREEYEIVKRIWEILGFDEYNSKGAPKKSIYEYIEEKDAEIERLKATLAHIDDHGRALSFMETLKAQDAEIKRLKRNIESLTTDQQREPCLHCYHEIVSEADRCNCGEVTLRAEIVRLKEENAHFAWRDEDKDKLIAQLKAVTDRDLEPIA